MLQRGKFTSQQKGELLPGAAGTGGGGCRGKGRDPWRRPAGSTGAPALAWVPSPTRSSAGKAAGEWV